MKIRLLHLALAIPPWGTFFTVWFMYQYIKARISYSFASSEGEKDKKEQFQNRVAYLEQSALLLSLAVVLSVLNWQLLDHGRFINFSTRLLAAFIWTVWNLLTQPT